MEIHVLFGAPPFQIGDLFALLSDRLYVTKFSQKLNCQEMPINSGLCAVQTSRAI